MKKISRYIFLLGALVLFVGLAPRFLVLDKVQETITEQLSKKLGGPVTVRQMQWAWLPLPHLSFSNTRIITEYSEFSAPEMKIYPNWRIILNHKVKLGSIHLESPEIYINKKMFQTEGPSGLTMPELSVHIKNGILKIESDENIKDVLLEDILIFSKIDGLLKMEQQQIEIEFHGATPFSKNLDLLGSFNPISKDYKFLLDIQDIKLHKSVNTILKGMLIPVESTGKLAVSIFGNGLQNIEGNFHGTLPSFAVQHKDRKTLLTPGIADFTLLKSGPLLRLSIKDLELKEPELHLSGLIEKKSSQKSNDIADQVITVEPIWSLDLNGRDLDLTSIRNKVLALWGYHKIAKIVCNIVLDGKAASAAYRFTGQTADFKDLDSMIIEADVLEAAIHVPGAELDLKKAKGPVLIKDSILTGDNLSAQLENSVGSNGKLLLDLSKDSKAFTLSIDIDADLEALPPVLEQLIHHEGFQKELSKFTEVSGRASGNLQLGDTLENIITRVDVEKMQLTGKYEPVPETIFINKGALHVGPKEVSWQKIKGSVGLQEIISTSGDVSWQTGDTLLHIKETQGQLDGKSLYTMLEQTEFMPGKIKDSLSSLTGKLDILKGTLNGNAGKPEAWEYQLTAKAEGISFKSPLLPEPAIIDKISATFSHNEAHIKNAEINFLDQSLNLKGKLNHQKIENWHGTVELNGPLQSKLADWISSKRWFSEKLRPKIPCTLENIRLGFEGKTITLSGKILQGLAEKKLPMAKIDLESTPEYLRINELSFFAPGEQGTLTLYSQNLPSKNFSLSWQGFVNAATIDALFNQSNFTDGTFGGAFFEVSYFPEQPQKTGFKGLLKAENLLLKGSIEKEPIVIKNILLTGTGEKLKINALDITIGTERVTGSGHIAAEQKGFLVDIDLTSSFLSKKSLNNLTQSLKKTHSIFLDTDVDQDEELLAPKGWDMTGRIGFDFNSFSVSRKSEALFNKARHAHHYTLYDMHGELQLAPDALTKTEISSSKLCGLDFKSTWYSDEALGQHFELATGSDTSLRLENVTPCLGVDQDLLEGEFSLKANLRKESGAWHDGNIYLKSTKGRILRLKLLSRIFKVVNITDLFKTEPGSTGKRGFPFSKMNIDTHILDNSLIFDRAILHGEGLNLFLQGNVHLNNYDADLTMLVAPFKSIDTLFSKVPLIGESIMSEYDSLVAIPVAIKGPLPDPLITPLPLKAVSGALINIVKEAIKLPYNILKPNEIPTSEP